LVQRFDLNTLSVSFYKDSRQQTNQTADEADKVFIKPKRKAPTKSPNPEGISEAEIIKREAEYWENRIREQRRAREERDAANPPAPTKQRRQRKILATIPE